MLPFHPRHPGPSRRSALDGHYSLPLFDIVRYNWQPDSYFECECLIAGVESIVLSSTSLYDFPLQRSSLAPACAD